MKKGKTTLARRLSRRDALQLMAAATAAPAVGGPLNVPANPTDQVFPAFLNPGWPRLTRYSGLYLNRVALPLGGIGAGTVSLGGRGDLRDWEIVNRPAKGFRPRNTFFCLYCRPTGGEPVTRLLEGPLPLELYEGATGATAANHGLPRFREAQFIAAYPFGQVILSDQGVPVDVRLEAFNPLIPGDADASGIPLVLLRFVLHNPSRQAISVSICGSMENFIGSDGKQGEARGNWNEIRQEGGLYGLFFQSHEVPRTAEQWGTLALATPMADGLSARICWKWSPGWNTDLTDFWDDFSEDGRLETRKASETDTPMGSLAVGLSLGPFETRAVTFLLAWHFPNRIEWKDPRDRFHSGPARVGNHYATQYQTAWDVVVKSWANLPELENKTVRFVSTFCQSDLPHVVKEAALYNLSTLRTQTCFRSDAGHLFGWEGCHDDSGCCAGSCTHVWNYEQATSFLFGDLAKTMREVEFLFGTTESGRMSFRINLPLERGTDLGVAAADGQMGCLMKLYRDWQLSGDEEFLKKLWPKARKAMEFCWIPGGWDADQDGVMEGAQHNTMDVEYYGPNPQMGLWYLGALRATEEMARHLGENAFADRCRSLFEKGSRWTDEQLFNGEYYVQDVRAIPDPSSIAEGLVSRHPWHGVRDPANPKFQLGDGCLVDQLVGQYMAHVCGLGYLVRPENILTTLKSIMKHNFKEDMSGHFNNMRSFVLNGESGILMATYPRGKLPEDPFPYYREVMTGFEYCASAHMLFEGLHEPALKVIQAIRDRYDGRKRNPFNEAECGNHYARAMASWAAVLALTGFQYSRVTETLRFAGSQHPATWFWSNGYSWGTIRQKPDGKVTEVELTVTHGQLRLKRLSLTGRGSITFAEPRTLTEGESIRIVVQRA